jgi:hypothetical protein
VGQISLQINNEVPKSLGDALAKLYKSKLLKDRIEAWDLLCKSVGTVPENYRRSLDRRTVRIPGQVSLAWMSTGKSRSQDSSEYVRNA